MSSTPKSGLISGDIDTYAKNIYGYARKVRDPHFLEFRLLQRINLAEYQNTLARQKAHFAESGSVSTEELENLRTTLHSYVTAIRDYEYLSSLDKVTGAEQEDGRKDLMTTSPFIGLHPSHPFNSLYPTFSNKPPIPSDPLRDFLKANLHRRVTWTRSEQQRHIDDWIARKPPEEVSPFVDNVARFINVCCWFYSCGPGCYHEFEYECA